MAERHEVEPVHVDETTHPVVDTDDDGERHVLLVDDTGEVEEVIVGEPFEVQRVVAEIDRELNRQDQQ